MNPYQQGQPGYPYQQPQHLQNVGFSNFAPQSFGSHNPGFNAAGYPPQNTGYPPQNTGYPPQNTGLPPQNSGFPTQNSGYPTQNSGYPTQNSGYPTQNSAYPTQNSAYPAQTGYPTPPTNAAHTPYPNAQAAHPSSQPYPSYPTQNNAHPPAANYPKPAAYQITQVQNPGSNQYGGYPGHTPFTGTPSYGQQIATPPRSRPTVVPANPFNPRADAEALRKAMKGFGTDEKTIIQIITKRTNEQRLRIAFEFKTLYGKDLVSDLKSETSGKFEDLVVALMTPLPQFYAKELHDAISGIGTDEDVLIEVMCTLSNHEIDVIKKAYTAMYGALLEDDLRGDTSGHFKRLMTSLCVGNRSEDFNVNQAKVREDAKSLLRAGEMRLGTNESVFNAILCSCSFPHLNAVFQEYHNITGHDIEDSIKSEFSGDLEKALKAIVKVVRNKPSFFAEVLHRSMKGMGTNDCQLIRVMVTRSEVDLQDITDAFLAKYGKTLQSFIEGDCSGHYKKCLLGLLGAY